MKRKLKEEYRERKKGRGAGVTENCRTCFFQHPKEKGEGEKRMLEEKKSSNRDGVTWPGIRKENRGGDGKFRRNNALRTNNLCGDFTGQKVNPGITLKKRRRKDRKGRKGGVGAVLSHEGGPEEEKGPGGRWRKEGPFF